MGGHGHHDDHHHVEVNPHAIPENDEDLPFRIRDITLIKHNPNLFHLWLYSPSNIY